MSGRSLKRDRTERRLESALRPLKVVPSMETPEAPLEAPSWALQLDVPGIPRPQGSKRHVGNGRMVEQSKELKPWRDSITHAAIQAGAIRQNGAVAVSLMFRFDRPKGHFGVKGLRPSAPDHKTTKPDIDKLSRAVLDALWPCWGDDAQVVQLTAAKRWCIGRELPGVAIELSDHSLAA